MVDTLADINPEEIRANPNNPRRFFNEDRLDLLRTSIQEVGILVPLIVYRDDAGGYVLMDGERRWRCSLDIALDTVPASIIPTPNPLDNLLRMFNIHNVREDWPLVSVSLSLREVMEESGELGEKRLSEMTGLTRSTVRRAKRLLSIPNEELSLIRDEAHLDRTSQVHREDLYLEIEAAESVLRNNLPALMSAYTRPAVIRSFASKAEVGSLNAVTDFRLVGRLVKALDDDILDQAAVEQAVTRLIADPNLSPKTIFDDVAAEGYQQQTAIRKAQVLTSEILEISLSRRDVSASLRDELTVLRDAIESLVGEES